METTRFSLMLCLVVFGAYSEYQAEANLRLSKAAKVKTILHSRGLTALHGNANLFYTGPTVRE